ncbi:D-2-hydroxyacid dehydrogenase [Paenibacillus lactis]|uniref:Phosphoglycerate dehydrogenase-like enzyme n=1 Tax=Paenibacillus lactis TaxID=228574 RepID=A0ABS4F8B4_9BACL|nr:D-2-hydroxyacid dehydrogenase [Paenibacillus lactis]MBP1892495.1 phosphoglycerate dehydrogenase-like enzyme [Paenibacillus lactis]MCM3493235.1 D-2-hydroxyacid dehydrogenase [Paenibacillus lactis]HAF97058.1 hydroxyacid dehydrogenase [Paenibacillus lactis]
MPKIIALHDITPQQRQKIKEIAPSYELTVTKAKDLAPGMIRNADILVGWSRTIEEEALAQDSKLKWIQAWSAGVDKLPLKKFEERAILLSNASGVHSVPITEHIFAMILAFNRNLHLAVRQQTNKRWDTSGTFTELAGKTIVIVGVGQIGSHTARIAQAFGMRTIGVRNSGKPDPHVDVMYTVDQIDEALSQGDYVVNILPLTAQTKDIFNHERFSAMKTSAFFVNVGRGATVITSDMIQALQSGALAGAGLDVFEEEPLPPEHPLWTMDNVIITPHMAGDTDRYGERAVEIFLDNLKSYVKDGTLIRNVIDYSRSY